MEIREKIERYEIPEGISRRDAYILDCMYDGLKSVSGLADTYDSESEGYMAVCEAYEVIADSIEEMYMRMEKPK